MVNLKYGKIELQRVRKKGASTDENGILCNSAMFVRPKNCGIQTPWTTLVSKITYFKMYVDNVRKMYNK